ncbi:MAG: acyl-CoA dehydratase activase [Dethiobacteria bacterium]|nr:hypothetical protein [Bacillota bacterium]HPT33191.1 acyl-CoA dehydratase activase [Bacillota bacterium]HQD05937.1 acyl-CoA dehydratase activase [Bacillota bacterium]
METKTNKRPRLGLDMGVFAVKGILLDGERMKKITVPTAGRPLQAAAECLVELLAELESLSLDLGLVGHNARLLARELGVKPLLEIEALQAGLVARGITGVSVVSLGHENIYYLELDEKGTVQFFSRNGQCAAGSGAFWYQQATRMGYNDRELAEIALQADSPVRISGRCAVFAKSDMTHAINEGATQSAVTAGMARALVETIVTSVAQNRIKGPGTLVAVGGVAENRAVIKYLEQYCQEEGVTLVVPPDHQYINAVGAAIKGAPVPLGDLKNRKLYAGQSFVPENPLPRLEAGRVHYLTSEGADPDVKPRTVYLGVDCGSVSTKCVLLDEEGRIIGGIYLPTTGRPALQVLELIKQVKEKYGPLLEGVPLVACTTGSGRFLSQRLIDAAYAVDEITCQAEGVKYLFGEEETLSIIEIGGEDSKFIQIKNGVLADYNMNPVCAAGTGTFLEHLAELLGVEIKEEFSRKAFQAEYAIDLGDTCTLLSQSTLLSAASRGLPLEAQLSSLAYSAARNYLSKTVENRPLEGRLVFTGATAMNTALAAAFAAECNRDIFIPPRPELTGALGSALMAKRFYESGEREEVPRCSLEQLSSYTVTKRECRAQCQHDHHCVLHVISFEGGGKFIYGDRCGRYSGLDRSGKEAEKPDYAALREKLFMEAAGEPLNTGPRVGIARSGMFFDLYPFWAAFFRSLGAQVVLSSETETKTLELGKFHLDSEMCYPMKVIVGHYAELADGDLDYIFVPEVVDMPPPPWAERWPRSFTCPLLQTLRGTVVNSLRLDPARVLYAQLNYRAGAKGIREQLRPVAKRLLGESYTEEALAEAVREGYRAWEDFQRAMERESARIMEELAALPDRVAAVFLSRPYTLYDDFVSKGSLRYARQIGMTALPHEFLYYYLQGWLAGRIESPYLQGRREELQAYLDKSIDCMDHIYPVQLQRILSSVFLAGFLNRQKDSALPVFHFVLQDPFKCGPNAMLRHFLNGLGDYLRLTLDEHTAAAGMITRLEAFRNTCRSRRETRPPEGRHARPRTIKDRDWHRILVPHPSDHARIMVSLFRRCGVEADLLPRSKDPDLTLARRYINGEECLPLIQNLEDFLAYLQQNGVEEGTVFFQGWACGPCRYGLYAPTQTLTLDRAGYGPGRICSVHLFDVMRRFGLTFALGVFDGMIVMDLLYKMLHRTRPYAVDPSSAEALYRRYAERLYEELENFRFNPLRLADGAYLRPLERLVAEAAEEFGRLEKRDETRPLILVGGEFYVRLDDRNNEQIIAKIEAAGGEACLAPASELFSYTAYIWYREACDRHALRPTLPGYLLKSGYAAINRLARRDEARLEQAAAGLLHDLEEPGPEEIMERAGRYISSHYGGEPPMTIGRAAAIAQRSGAAGAVFVAPFTCMPGSYVEAQQGMLRQELGLPVITVYYDGKENAGRDEMIEGLVFQARQMLERRA